MTSLPEKLVDLRKSRIAIAKAIHGHIVSAVNEYQRLYEPVQTFVRSAEQMDMPLPLDFEVKIDGSGFQEQFLNRLNRQARGSFSGIDERALLVRNLLKEAGFEAADDAIAFAERIDDMLCHDRRDAQGRETRLSDQLRKGVEPQEILDYLYGLAYLAPRYSLTYDRQEISQLSPGERGLLLLVFYLLVDKDDIPIVIDQPEENLDNQTIFRVLVKCIKVAKERRQVIMVTHNPNLAVVCDAEQIIHAHCDKAGSHFSYESGGIENPEIPGMVVQPNKWKKQGQIFAISHRCVDYFPGYGLDRDSDFRPVRALAKIIETFAGHKDSWGMAYWFRSDNSFLGGKRPQDLLASAPERVIEAVMDEVQETAHG